MALFLPRQLSRVPFRSAELDTSHPIYSLLDAAWSFSEYDPKNLIDKSAGSWIFREGTQLVTPYGIGYSTPVGNHTYRAVSLTTAFPYVAFVIAWNNAGGGQEDFYSLGDNNASGAFLRMFVNGSPLRYSLLYRSQNGVATINVSGPLATNGLVVMAAHIPSGTATAARLYVNGEEYTGTGTNQANTNVGFERESVGGLFTNSNFGQLRTGTTLFAARGRPSTVDQRELLRWTADPWSLFRPAANQTFYSLPSVAAAQTLTPNRYDNTQAFYSPTVTAGAVTLTPDRYDNAQSFYSPTVTTTVDLLPGRYDNISTFYTPTVTAGAVTLLPGRYDNASTFYSPTVTSGAFVLLPDRYDNAQTFYSPTVTVGTVTLTPARYDNAQTFYTPTVSLASQTLLPDRFDNVNTFYSPSLAVVTLYKLKYWDGSAWQILKKNPLF